MNIDGTNLLFLVPVYFEKKVTFVLLNTNTRRHLTLHYTWVAICTGPRCKFNQVM